MIRRSAGRARFAGGVCAMLLVAVPSWAGNPGDTPEYPTRFVNVGKPLEALLSSGYRVVSSHLGLDTIGYVLEHDGKWVTCSVRNGDKASPDRMMRNASR